MDTRVRVRNTRQPWLTREWGGMPMWGFIVLILLAIAGAGAWVWHDRQPTPVRTWTPPPPAIPPVVSVVGDSYTGGSNMDSGREARWPALLGDDYAITTFHVGGSGYVTPAQQDGEPSTYVTRAAEVDPESDLVLFFGSINDVGASPEDVTAAAAEAVDIAEVKAPGANIVVVGPASPEWPVPDELIEVRDAVAAAAMEARVVFIDPIESGWFDGRAGLIGDDGIHPNDAGQTYLAGHFSAILREYAD
ncbi:SGNH/GDSL hydrolase family protein [Demequina sp. SYSU T00192]|uniref:SGNH/GDSL hydrolase family protein n=1 Tax=Demequina litoralis TaxID=3051660 RepID=A0ABT8G8X1_9MICO|nr:SGNH/GDSL hydrolase family protein [Demequina sp. SYSU T00192]MDN4475447.1 SGNH/GDSL hydrolase family protein [Demequina sp. SYSU T00192]